jgi:uncharacterized protein YjbI with pentapeptide repeats
MAVPEQVALLSKGADVWNEWRRCHRRGTPDLSKVNLDGLHLQGANLRLADLGGGHLSHSDLRHADLRGAFLGRVVFTGCNLAGANLKGATLIEARLDGANLQDADLRHANLRKAHLTGANLARANLTGANLHQTDFDHADLSAANLTSARLVETSFRGSRLERCCVYGIAAWSLDVADATQLDLLVTAEGEAAITVDDIEVAQFVHILLDNRRLRKCIDTVTSKLVLLLGRFSAARKPALEAIREELRRHDLVPVVFDFDRPARRDLTETVSTLAHLARFVVVDLTDPRSVPQELMRIVPGLPSVPVQPVLHVSDTEYSMFEHLKSYPWVHPVLRYEHLADLTSALRARFLVSPRDS